MKFYQKYKVNVNDYTHDYARYSIGSLKEVLDGLATIWKSYSDYEYYTLDTKTASLFEDLEIALINLEDLRALFEEAASELYEDDAPIVGDWISDYFYPILDDASEVIRHFRRWDDAQSHFNKMALKMTGEKLL